MTTVESSTSATPALAITLALAHASHRNTDSSRHSAQIQTDRSSGWPPTSRSPLSVITARCRVYRPCLRRTNIPRNHGHLFPRRLSLAYWIETPFLLRSMHLWRLWTKSQHLFVDPMRFSGKRLGLGENRDERSDRLKVFFHADDACTLVWLTRTYRTSARMTLLAPCAIWPPSSR